HDTGAESIGTADFQDVLSSCEHFCHEFVSSEGECKPLRIIAPGLVDHQTQRGKAMLLLDLEQKLILRLFGLFRIAHGCSLVGERATDPSVHAGACRGASAKARSATARTVAFSGANRGFI